MQTNYDNGYRIKYRDYDHTEIDRRILSVWFWEFDNSYITTRYANDLQLNDALLEMFGDREVIDVHHVLRKAIETADRYRDEQLAKEAACIIKWGFKEGLIECIRTSLVGPLDYELLDRRNQFIEIGPIQARRCLRVFNNWRLSQAEIDNLVDKEKRRQLQAEKRAQAVAREKRREVATSCLDRMMEDFPEAWLRDGLVPRVEGFEYLRSYREVLIDAAVGEDGDQIVAGLIAIHEDQVATLPATKAVDADDEVALTDISF